MAATLGETGISFNPSGKGSPECFHVSLLAPVLSPGLGPKSIPHISHNPVSLLGTGGTAHSS